MLRKIPIISILLTSAVLAQPPSVPREDFLSPPEGARLVGSEPTVRLSWPGPPQDYDLQILASGRTYYQNHGKGNSEIVKLAPNIYYTWSVTLTGAPGIAPAHHFQLSSDLNYSFDGARGNQGLSNPTRYDSDGHRGGPGQPGQTVNVFLAMVGDLVSVRLDGASRKANFLLLPNSAPVVISARGGDGGQGAPGQDGAAGYYGADGYGYPATPGCPGAPGGDGAAGGQVLVHSSLPPGFPSLLKINVEGGQPGPGGLGGIGGTALAGYPRAVPSQQVYHPTPPQPDGPRGPSGPDGRPGPPGLIRDIP